jgi:hypothetical protein
MLNAAWVRDEPDYSGDMRRLNRVIERMTRLRQKERATDTWIPLLLGVLLSAATLIAADVLTARLVVSAYLHMSQATLILAGGELLIADLLIYGLTGGLVTRWSGKRQNGVLAALLGASLEMLAATVAVRLTQASGGATFETLIGTQGLVTEALGAIAVYVALRPPIQTFGAIMASSLGAFYGRIAYRGRVRRLQEQQLYAMASAAIPSQSVLEMVAPAPARLTSEPIAPESIVMPAALTVDGLITPSQAAESVEPVQATDGAGEEIRRERLLSEMQAARQRARTQRQRRLGVFLGLSAAALLIASIGTGLVYQSQIHTVNANTLSAARQTAIAVAATATYVASPNFIFSEAEFGPDCPGMPGAVWSSHPTSESVSVACNDTYSTVSNNDLHPSLMTVTLGHPYTPTYQLGVKIDGFDYVGTCVGLVAEGQVGSLGSAVVYQVCWDGLWSIFTVKNDGTKIKELAHGGLIPQFGFQLTVRVLTNENQFLINGHVVKTFANSQLSRTTDFTGVSLNYGVESSDYVGADVSNYTYQPVAPSQAPTG